MRCNNCGSEWSTGINTSNSHRCPFCGKTVLHNELSEENLTLPVVLKQITDRFGLKILLNKQKCIGLFKDFAPTLTEEQKILEVALKLDVETYFFDVQEDERKAAIKKAVSAMEGILADEAIESVLSAFVTALNWDTSLLKDLLIEKKVYYHSQDISASQNNTLFTGNTSEGINEERIPDNVNLREERIKAATEATLQKADALKERTAKVAVNVASTVLNESTLQTADALKEKAYVAAGVAANIASVILKKASEKVTEAGTNSGQAPTQSTNNIQTFENTIDAQKATDYSEYYSDETDSDVAFMEVNKDEETLTNYSSQVTSSTATGQNILNSVNNSVTVSQNVSTTPTAANSPTFSTSSGTVSPNNSQQQKSSNKMKFGMIAALVLILSSIGLFSLANTGKNISQPSKPKTTHATQSKQSVTPQSIIKPPIAAQKSNLDLAKEFLSSLGYHREAPSIKATTYGLSTDGFLFYEFKLIWIVDSKRNRIACLLNTSDVIGKYKSYRKSNTNNPLILKLGIGKDTQDKDANNGIWEKDKNNFHLIPVYVLYDFNSDGTMVDKGLFSGEGENPSHFHNYLYEQKNVDMVNIFLKQLPYFDQSVFNDFPMAEDSSINKPMASQSSVKSTNNSVEARNTFIRFHQAITDKRLGDAYFTLSPNYRKIMRSYDNFARGYITTLRSDIVELNTLHEDSSSASYSYKLKAVDREGSGTKTQYFSGKVKLIKINGNWLIDNTEAKRL